MPQIPSVGGGMMPAYGPPGGGDMMGGMMGGQGGGDGAVDPPVAKILKDLVAQGTRAAQMEDDEQISHAILKAVQQLQSILAGLQKQSEAALGVTPQMKGMARQYG